MDIIKWSIARPVTISVGVILVVLFGLIGVAAIPIQLTPTVDKPIVTVNTVWPGREPQEIVDEVTRKQEEKLKNVQNLRLMRSTSRQGGNTITLEFTIGTNIDRALADTAEKLRQVSAYPEEVEEPFINSTEGGIDTAIAWLIIDLPEEAMKEHPDFDIATLQTGLDRAVKPRIERVNGVAETQIFGGREREIHVEVDPLLLAQRGLSYDDVLTALRRENRDVSAGTIDEGKREVRVRVLGRYGTLAEIENTVVAYRESRPVYVRDLGVARVGYEKILGFVKSDGRDCIAMPVIRQSGANVKKVMAELRQVLDEIRREELPRLDPVVGSKLRLRQVYDETRYIDASIDLVLDNLWQGGVLSVICLLIFLRSFKATGIIAITIPICLIATFLVVLAAGRTLNVVSLAGLAFATGVVVDNANVVIENIFRRRELGDPPMVAVYRGTKEVWTAILAATLTTAMVFVPILTIQEEAGQLFFDLTLALSTSVLISVFVAITVVPAAAGVLFGKPEKPKGKLRKAFEGLFGLAALGARFSHFLGTAVYFLITSWRAAIVRPILIVAMVVASLVGSLWLMPPLDYLPTGNQNLVFGFMAIPPGQSIEQQHKMAARAEVIIKPYIGVATDDEAALATLPKIQRGMNPATGQPLPPFEPVGLEQFFIGTYQGNMFGGGMSMDTSRVKPLEPLISQAIGASPDTFGFASQASIFAGGAQGSSGVEVEVSGPDLARVTNAVKMMQGVAMGQMEKVGFPMGQPMNFNLDQSDIRLRLTDRGRELGLRTEDLGTVARSLFDGAFAGEYTLDGRTIDIVVIPSGGRLTDLTQLPSTPIVTPTGQTVQLSSVAEIVPGRSTQEINRSEELPSVMLQFSPPQGEPLGKVIETIENNVIAPARAAGLIDSSMQVRLEGSAAKLDKVQAALFGRPHAGDETTLQKASFVLAWVAWGAGAIVAVVCIVRGARRGAGTMTYATIGALLLALIVGALFWGLAERPTLLTARFVWAILVCYLLMAALFESFLYPLVIMFSVPPGIVGGFWALDIVHDVTTANPDRSAPQNLDMLTMIGFFMLIGNVVANAILLVEQTLNFMNPAKLGEEFAHEKALAHPEAIRDAVRTRLRPIMMTSLTTVTGGIPLVLAPGAGSEMYRGLGAVVLGGLIVSTIFTLFLVPMVLSLVLDMKLAVQRVLGREERLVAPAESAVVA